MEKWLLGATLQYQAYQPFAMKFFFVCCFESQFNVVLLHFLLKISSEVPTVGVPDR
jgi:hypothetical protein